jgi:hypothetical protein
MMRHYLVCPVILRVSEQLRSQCVCEPGGMHPVTCPVIRHIDLDAGPCTCAAPELCREALGGEGE